MQQRFDIGSAIGNTPLVELARINPNPRVRILAKLEGNNPGGSVKDRPVLRMVEDAERAGLLPGSNDSPPILLDSSSGNAGIAYAMIAASMRYPVTICLPLNANAERKALRHAGGSLVPGVAGG